MDCLFCKIINKEIPTDLIYEDEKVVAFKDINPQAPVHILVLPKEHIASNNEITNDNVETIGHVFKIIKKLAQDNGLNNGYRIVNNCGEDGGQSVQHIHYHLLGGRQMLWPPG